MTEKKIFFQDKQGNKICGILSNPTEDKTKPIIILCHGFSTSKDSSTYKTMQESLNQHQLSTFRFDFYGHGESDGKFEDITLTKAVNNILETIVFLKKQGYPQIGLLGSSFGGNASLLATCKIKDIFVLALKCPVSNYFENQILKKSPEEIANWKTQGFIYYFSNTHQKKKKLKYSFFEDIKNYKNDSSKYKTITLPTIIVHGDQDITVPVEQSKKTAEIIPHCTLEIIKGADHFFKGPGHFTKMIKLLTNFIIKHSK